MKKIIDKYKKIILPIYIILNILYINVCSYLVQYEIIDMKYYSQGLINLLILSSIIILLLLIYNFINKKNKIKMLDILLIFIIIFSIISVIFAIDVDLALYGITGRYEGLFSILYYFSLYFISTYIDNKYKKSIVYIIIIFGFIQAVYAILQISNINIFNMKIIRIYNSGKIWANGFTTNPNFFGSYMLICIAYVIGLYFDNKDNNIIDIDYLLIIIIFMIGILISNTLSCLIGLFIILLYLLIYIVKNKKYLKYVILFAILLLTTLTVSRFGNTTLIKDLNKTVYETKEITRGNVDDSYGTKRMFIWKSTLKIVPKNIIHGVGIENFIRAFNGRILIRSYNKNGQIKYNVYDKAHNEYLQILITEGIFSLLSYLAFYGLIIVNGVKRSFTNKEIYLILPIIGYLVQAFFNISVIEVAPIFYISLGLCVERENDEKSKCYNPCI